MSQYLSFELVNKANPEIKVDLGYWCTSIARGITYNFNNIFTYTNDGDVELDKETLESYINELHAGIDDFKYYDSYISISSLDKKFDYQTQLEIVKDALSVLGKEYQELLQELVCSKQYGYLFVG